MTAIFRTITGGHIDRSRTLRFSFDGKRYTGLAGDTLASALLANGVHLMARSFKYHRPRGVLAAGAEEPNALVTVRRDAARCTPNLRATQVELYDGLEAHSQNRWPSLAFDIGAINNLLSPLFPAGFYYKTFMWPRSAWKALYEPTIRAAAGLGRAPTCADPDRYANRYAHCDVLVVGGGPSGLAAALAAAAAGARVILCDEQAQLGGSLLADATTEPEQSGASWLAQSVAALRDNARVTLLARSTAFGYFPHNLIGVNQRLSDHLADPAAEQPRELCWQVRAREVVLATGAIERPLVFPGNDRPGIMLASAARSYLNRYAVIAGRRALLVTACDDAYRTALELQRAGVAIAMIADVRARADGPWAQAARSAGLPLQTQCTLLGTRGRLRVSSVRLARLDADRRQIGGPQTIACDLVLMCGGFTPSVHLHSQSRGKLAWDDSVQGYLPAQPAERTRSAGACRGVFSLAAALQDGAAAGAAAARDAAADQTGSSGLQRSLRPLLPAPDAAMAGLCGALPQPQGSSGAKAFVDWQNDVTTRDLALAMREGFVSVEHLKRYTTTGMATDQGKTSNLNALGVVAQRLDKSIADIGLTTFRMPYTPVSFGSFAGFARAELFDPVRTTPIHEWAARHGAVFEDVSLWKRARYFPQAGEDMHAAVTRECRAVRSACGIFDASTLGKIEVVGPDALTFMNRLYINAWNSLAVGRCRYGVLLREDGFLLDDGVVARTAADRLHVTTTTGGAARVLALMEDYLQTEWPELRVWLTSTTEQWAVIALQGPLSRLILQGLVEDIDLSATALPHMGAARGRICGAPALLFRVSFTGELGFEINVPADFALTVWEAICRAGAPHGLTPYGTEAMHVLRAEKGYIIIGQETDGTVTPDDVGLSWAIGKNKPDFVGKRSLARPALGAADRKQLVGLLTADPHTVLEEGSQVMAAPEQQPTRRPIGHVTSSYYSPALERSIALAMVAGGRARIGQALSVPTPTGALPVTVTASVFYDPEGTRLNG
ncbi:MAG TPA: sarcosine oxidase subunit alpha family protein [Steroidobacteraceae bacterium]